MGLAKRSLELEPPPDLRYPMDLEKYLYHRRIRIRPWSVLLAICFLWIACAIMPVSAQLASGCGYIEEAYQRNLTYCRDLVHYPVSLVLVNNSLYLDKLDLEARSHYLQDYALWQLYPVRS